MRMPAHKQANTPVLDIDPVFGKMAGAMRQATWTIPELTQREKCFACLTADVCLHDIDLPFHMHVQMALAEDACSSDSQFNYCDNTSANMEMALLKMWSPLMRTSNSTGARSPLSAKCGYIRRAESFGGSCVIECCKTARRS